MTLGLRSEMEKLLRNPTYAQVDRRKVPSSKYSVLLDGYPIDNPPVMIGDIIWSQFQCAPSELDGKLEFGDVFAMQRYEPTGKLVLGTVIILFNTPERAD